METYVVLLKLRGRLALQTRPLQSFGPAKRRHWPSWRRRTARESINHEPGHTYRTSNTTTHASCAKLHSLTTKSPHTHHGTRHFLGRASPVHQLGCAPQARHSLESGARQLRSSDCGMISCRRGQMPWTNAEKFFPTGHRTSSSRTPRRPQQTDHSSHIPR
jgi:hypothetical protein